MFRKFSRQSSRIVPNFYNFIPILYYYINCKISRLFVYPINSSSEEKSFQISRVNVFQFQIFFFLLLFSAFAFNFNLIHFSFFLLSLDFILLLLLQFLFNSNNYYIIFFKLIFFFLPRFHSISTIYYLFFSFPLFSLFSLLFSKDVLLLVDATSSVNIIN